MRYAANDHELKPCFFLGEDAKEKWGVFFERLFYNLR
jgi:hypothetical protein